MLLGRTMPDFPPTEEAPLSSVSEVDIFNGIKVRAKLLAPNLDAIAFGSLLEESLKVWTREERTGVWVFVPNSKSSPRDSRAEGASSLQST